MLNEIGLTRGQVIRYTLLPQILPRIRNLLGSGFINFPYFIMVVFNTLGIIPANHPYLRRDHHGKYSLIQALTEASNHIEFSWKNADKVTLFGLILAAVIMFFLQIFLCLMAIFTSSAFAYSGPGLGPRTTGEFYDNDNASTDIAFRVLDLVFGIPGIFNSSDMGTTPFHSGLHALFQFYSFGMLLIGTFIIIYLVVTIVLETAESGVPFGQRFNGAWAPIRLIVFFGLLLPTANGINLAQYLLLNAAKMGSNVATNGWIQFDKATKNAYIASENLIAKPSAPDMNTFLTFMQLARTCAQAEGRINGRDVKAYIVYGNGKANAEELGEGGPAAFSDIVNKADGGTVSVRFGVQDDKYSNQPGTVFPFCGELGMTIVDQAQPGSAMMQQAYLELTACYWHAAAFSPSGGASVLGSSAYCKQTMTKQRAVDFTNRYGTTLPYQPFPDMKMSTTESGRSGELMFMSHDMQTAINKSVQTQIDDSDWNNDAAMKFGWAGAGIWFNKIAEQNGAMTSAVFAKPEVISLPYVMEFVRKEKLKQNPNLPLEQMFTPVLASGKIVRFEEPSQRDVLVILNQIYLYWGSDHAVTFLKSIPESRNQETTGNVIIDVMNAMMGTRGLFDMCKNTDIHPLAQIASLGKGLVEHSIRGFGVALGIGVTGGMLSLLGKQNFAQSIQVASGFFTKFASIGLAIGFLLFYVVPILPFIYFFFALMTWVKSIFEAMVGMPLWALAHLRIDGEGLPGDAAQAGYYYILEIFLRPVCILIGFLGSILIFAALVKVLNEIFYLAISNLSGHYVPDNTYGCFKPPGGAAAGAAASTELVEESFRRGIVDQFFYTVVYTIIVYMIGLSCFKLVDQIPDSIMRWMGAGIQSFGAGDGDPAQGLTQYVSMGVGSLSGMGKAFGFGGGDD